MVFGVMVLLSGCGGSDDAAEPPDLVVLMSVDQLSAALLYRYDSIFTGGFRRILDEGYQFTQATHDHAMTATAPGHTTLSTGVYPARHGIVGNSWSELRNGEWTGVYSMEDTLSGILGLPDLPGRSPANMYRGGLPDWILEQSPDSRVVSVSRKDRAAIGLAGMARGDVFWLESRSGRFVTTSFYHDEYPGWVGHFNDVEMPEIYADTLWESTVPEAYRGLSRPDTSEYEVRGRRQSFFPHHVSENGDPTDPTVRNRWHYSYTPYPDAAVAAFAKTAIQELRLGQRGVTDFLGVSFSQTDIIGHEYGPYSREQLDNLLRLDRELGELLAFLDEQVGSDRWVLALSADHGILPVPEHLAEGGMPAWRRTRDDDRQMREAVTAQLDQGEEAIRDALLSVPSIAAAYTFTDTEAMNPVADSFQVLFGRVQSRERVLSFPARYGVHMRSPEYTLGAAADASTHGSPYYYDRHVPVVFLGAGVSAGTSASPVATVDVAPTLARLIGIEAPDDLDGQPILPGG